MSLKNYCDDGTIEGRQTARRSMRRLDRRQAREICREELDTFYADEQEDREALQRAYDEWNAWDAEWQEAEALRSQEARLRREDEDRFTGEYEDDDPFPWDDDLYR